MAELTVPQVDFSALGQLPGIWKQGQADALRQQTLANLGQGGTADAAALLKSGDLSLAQLGINMQNHQDTLRQQAAQDARNSANDKFNHYIQSENLGISKARAGREASDFENTPDQYAPNPKFGQPGEPQYIDQYAQATAAASSAKPIPVETIGGTKFMVRQPNGGYSLIDPATMGQQPVPSSPSVVGDAEGVSRGIYDPPNAQGQRPPVQTVDAQPANFTDRFQGQQAPSRMSKPADLEAIDPQTGRREDFLKSLDPQVQGYIKKIADYEIDPRTTSIKGGMREKVLSAVAQYDPAYQQADYASRAKAIRDFSTGTQGNAIRSFDVAVDHLDTLKKYTTALGNGDTRIINAIRDKWLAETGSPLPTNVQAIAPIVGAEVSKAVIGSNNALADREELRKPLALANSPQQINGAIEGYQMLMGGQLKGLKKQYEDTTGKKNFDSRLRENTRKVLGGGEKASPVTIDGYTIKEN